MLKCLVISLLFCISLAHASNEEPVRAWWRGEGNANDELQKYHGTTYNGVGFVTGKVGSAFFIDGNDDRVSLSDIPIDWSSSFTIQTWLRIEDFPGPASNFGWGMIFFRGDDRNGLDSCFLATQAGDRKLYFHIESETGSENLTLDIETNRWLHVTGAFDANSGSMKLFINGKLAAERSTTVRPLQELLISENAISIGNHSAYPGTPYNMPFHGAIDEIRVYSSALTEKEAALTYMQQGGEITMLVENRGAEIAVMWPAFLEGAMLEAASSLEDEWREVGSSPLIVEGWNTIIAPIGGGHFFRLRLEQWKIPLKMLLRRLYWKKSGA